MNSVSGMTLRGVKAVAVEVEVEITGGLFNISVVGLPDCVSRLATEVRAQVPSKPSCSVPPPETI